MLIRRIFKIVDSENILAAIMLVLPSCSSIVFTTWTDWTLMVDARDSSDIPDYLWPREEYVRQPIMSDSADDIEVLLVNSVKNEVGELVGADMKFTEFNISVRSVGGEIEFSIL
jgi:hypothetical protein